MKKQTAVNSLIEQLLPFIDRSKISDTALQNIIEEHLAMEKEQIEEAFMNGELFGEEKYASDYYKETFKKNTND